MIDWICKHKKLVFFIGVLAMGVFIGCPLFMQYCIIENDIVSKGSNDGWLSFFGSYLGGIWGGIIGGCITLYVLEKTLKSNKEALEESRRQFDEDKTLQIRPYLEINCIGKNRQQCNVADSNRAQIYCGRNYAEYYDSIELVIRNIGLGAAIGVRIKDVIVCQEKLELRKELINKIIEYSLPCEGEISINLGYSGANRKCINSYGELCIKISFKDLLDNNYLQEFHIRCLDYEKDERMYIVTGFTPKLI